MEHITLLVIVIVAAVLLFNSNRCYVRYIDHFGVSRRTTSFWFFFFAVILLVAAATISKYWAIGYNVLLLLYFLSYSLFKIQSHRRIPRSEYEEKSDKTAIKSYIVWIWFVGVTLVILSVIAAFCSFAL